MPARPTLRRHALLAGALALFSAVTLASGKAPRHLSPSVSKGSSVPLSDSGPEPMLARVFEAIEQNRLDDALEQADVLTRAYPNFRLAHLIKGDLLLARTRPLKNFGEGVAAAPAAGEKVADLREEALARLHGFRQKPGVNNVPRGLLQMHPQQKHAVVIDTVKARLYLYQNDQHNGGVPRLVADYYISYGKLGADKWREGDKKTPVGVYHVTANLPRQKLTDFYGSGAFPINYPNEWDRRQGRNGHGIWLHGTPSDTFSRPPKASDGCVVLANQDLDALAKSLQVGLTPVIISNGVEWVSLDDWKNERESLLSMIEEWRQDWESRDIERYARHYSEKFSADGAGYRAWVEQKRKVNAGKSWIKVATGNVTMFRSREDYVVVTFEQDYRSNNLNNAMKKRQYWVKEDGRWKIVHEGAA